LLRGELVSLETPSLKLYHSLLRLETAQVCIVHVYACVYVVCVLCMCMCVCVCLCVCMHVCMCLCSAQMCLWVCLSVFWLELHILNIYWSCFVLHLCIVHWERVEILSWYPWMLMVYTIALLGMWAGTVLKFLCMMIVNILYDCRYDCVVVSVFDYCL